jgi:Sec-independent protein translocase protein TatA
MFEVGFTEIVLILGLALLVLGPEKLPALAEKVGRWTGRARAMARQLRTQSYFGRDGEIAPDAGPTSATQRGAGAHACCN